jgi:hypothetical protein
MMLSAGCADFMKPSSASWGLFTHAHDDDALLAWSRRGRRRNLIGSNHSANTLRIKEFFTRNGHPYSYIDLEDDAEVQGVLDDFHLSIDQIPVVICSAGTTLRNLSNREIADWFNPTVDESQVHDLVIVGAGPSGLAVSGNSICIDLQGIATGPCTACAPKKLHPGQVGVTA